MASAHGRRGVAGIVIGEVAQAGASTATSTGASAARPSSPSAPPAPQPTITSHTAIVDLMSPSSEENAIDAMGCAPGVPDGAAPITARA